MEWALARDVAVTVLGGLMVVALIALLIAGVFLFRLFSTVRSEVKPIIRLTSHTAETVRGTTSLVSTTLVSPIVRGASIIVGVRTMFAALFRGPKTSKE